MITRRAWISTVALAARAGYLEDADTLLQKQTESGEVESAALLVRAPSFDLMRGYGHAKESTPFLIASITKPMTVSAVMLLRDEGALKLDDPVQKYIPEFAGGARANVTVKHLLTHTSGLPDMLPENEDLRKKHAPLSAFIAGACRTPLLFEPGTKVSYQSMGILLAASIAERITEQSFPSFLRTRIFTPLGMSATSLGLGGRKIADCARSQVAEATDWDWNSPYWRNLAAPWGGAHSTVADIAAFASAFRDPDATPWKPGTAREMVTIQTSGLNGAWGLGWSRNVSGFGKECSAATWGHSGSTGTLCWYDPAGKMTFVLLTSKPAAQSSKTTIRPVSDLASSLLHPRH